VQQTKFVLLYRMPLPSIVCGSTKSTVQSAVSMQLTKGGLVNRSYCEQ